MSVYVFIKANFVIAPTIFPNRDFILSRSTESNKRNQEITLIEVTDTNVVAHSLKKDASSIIKLTKIPETLEIRVTINNGIKIIRTHSVILIFNIAWPKNNLAIEHATTQIVIVQLMDKGLPPIANTPHAMGMLAVDIRPVVI